MQQHLMFQQHRKVIYVKFQLKPPNPGPNIKPELIIADM